MKAKIKTYTPPKQGYLLRLGFEEITTIKMALEDKMRQDFSKRRSALRKKETHYTINALRGIEGRSLYVD